MLEDCVTGELVVIAFFLTPRVMLDATIAMPWERNRFVTVLT
jgi:hypothetical protein